MFPKLDKDFIAVGKNSPIKIQEDFKKSSHVKNMVAHINVKEEKTQAMT
jgi:hypothetical protein